MSTINQVFEIHLHGQVQLREDVVEAEVIDALKPLWSQTGEDTFKRGAASIYEDEPGLVLDQIEHVLRICWTVVGEMGFHQNLEEFCMGLNELTAMGAAFEVTFYNEQFEMGDQEDFVPDEDEEGEFFEESTLLFVGPTPAAIMDVQRDVMVQDMIHILERHFEPEKLEGVIREVDKLFVNKFETLIDSLERMPHSTPGKLSSNASPKGSNKSKSPRRSH